VPGILARAPGRERDPNERASGGHQENVKPRPDALAEPLRGLHD